MRGRGKVDGLCCGLVWGQRVRLRPRAWMRPPVVWWCSLGDSRPPQVTPCPEQSGVQGGAALAVQPRDTAGPLFSPELSAPPLALTSALRPPLA